MIAIIAFVWAVRDIIAILFFAVVVSSAITPTVNRLERFRIPRVITALAIYLLVFGFVGAVLSIILPSLARELVALISNLKDNPVLFGGLNTLDQLLSSSQEILRQLMVRISQDGTSVLAGFSSILGGVASVVLTLAISFYLTLKEHGIKSFINMIMPAKHHAQVHLLIERTQATLGRWLKGQLLLGLIVGVLVFLGLYFLGNKYAVSLAIIAGIFELIPYLGPILAAVPGVLIAFSLSQDLLITALTLGWYVVVQQLENNLIVPVVIGRAVHLDPIFVMLAVLIGAKLGGFTGIVLAVPIAALVAEYVKGSTGVEFKFRGTRAKKVS